MCMCVCVCVCLCDWKRKREYIQDMIFKSGGYTASSEQVPLAANNIYTQILNLTPSLLFSSSLPRYNTPRRNFIFHKEGGGGGIPPSFNNIHKYVLHRRYFCTKKIMAHLCNFNAKFLRQTKFFSLFPLFVRVHFFCRVKGIAKTLKKN